MPSTRTVRNPAKYYAVTAWGFTHIPWREFVKDYPTEAQAFAEQADADLDAEELAEDGPSMSNDQLWDDEVFLDMKGRPAIMGNITGPGGSMWLAFVGDGWDEVLYDDNGNREDDPDYVAD